MLSKIQNIEQISFLKKGVILVRGISEIQIEKTLKSGHGDENNTFFKVDFVNNARGTIGLSATERSIPLLARPFQVERCICKWRSIVEDNQWWILSNESK